MHYRGQREPGARQENFTAEHAKTAERRIDFDLISLFAFISMPSVVNPLLS
jgi:hypothetical protein